MFHRKKRRRWKQQLTCWLLLLSPSSHPKKTGINFNRIKIKSKWSSFSEPFYMPWMRTYSINLCMRICVCLCARVWVYLGHSLDQFDLNVNCNRQTGLIQRISISLHQHQHRRCGRHHRRCFCCLPLQSAAISIGIVVHEIMFSFETANWKTVTDYLLPMSLCAHHGNDSKNLNQIHHISNTNRRRTRTLGAHRRFYGKTFWWNRSTRSIDCWMFRRWTIKRKNSL